MAKVNVEELKLNSDGLRGDIVSEFSNEKSNVTEETYQLLKFHGMYLQDDRDQRKQRSSQGLERAFSFMIRSRIPGGIINPAQYLAHDKISDQWGNHTLRITTREAFQVHGILKGDVKSVIQTINQSLLSTISACGDVNRNVIVSTDPVKSKVNLQLQVLAEKIADHLTPKSTAYHEIWLDGEPALKAVEEPIYGKTYLPRKFKIAITKAGDNSIDVFTNDIGIVAILRNDQISGYNLYIGGGLGKTHNMEETFPRLADPLGFVKEENIIEVVEAIVKVQRDHGNRENRKLARMKYLVASKGISWFHDRVAEFTGFKLDAIVPVTDWQYAKYLGWTEQQDGKWTYGLFVENGRVLDKEGFRLKSALKKIATNFNVSFRLTATQDIQIRDISENDKLVISDLLADHGVGFSDSHSETRTASIACPALPTCGLALTESERVMPDIISLIDKNLTEAGLPNFQIVTRMTGCPNGCARPYAAELAFVGKSGINYEIHVGGSHNGTRLTQVYKDSLPSSHFDELFKDLFTRFASEKNENETFGDWSNRSLLNR